MIGAQDELTKYVGLLLAATWVLCGLYPKNFSLYRIYFKSDLFQVANIYTVATFTLQDLHVISTDENRVVAAVQEWNQNDTYNLYVSEAGGVYYTLALENVMSSMGPEGNVMIELYEVFHLNLSETKTNSSVMNSSQTNVEMNPYSLR